MTGIYAGVLGLLSLFLSMRVATLRKKTLCFYGSSDAKGRQGAQLEALSRVRHVQHAGYVARLRCR